MLCNGSQGPDSLPFDSEEVLHVPSGDIRKTEQPEGCARWCAVHDHRVKFFFVLKLLYLDQAE